MKKQRGWTLTELISALAFIAGMALFVGAVWAVIHFVLKFW